jgi:periplasmic protein CpxP/Spy
MKFAPQHLIAAGLLAALGLAAHAQTPPPGAPGAEPAPMARQQHHGRYDPAKMQEHMARRLAALKQKLQLAPAQESAWATFTSAMKPPARMQRPDRAEFEKLTTPERLDRMRAMRAARAAEMDKRADATKTFYASLTAEQKKVFDAESVHRRGGGRHHRG